MRGSRATSAAGPSINLRPCSSTTAVSETRSAPLWSATLARSGRHYTFNARIDGVDRDFDAQAGFIARRNVVDYAVNNNWTFFNAPGSRLETWGFGIRGQQTGTYEAFVDGRAARGPTRGSASICTSASANLLRLSWIHPSL